MTPGCTDPNALQCYPICTFLIPFLSVKLTPPSSSVLSYSPDIDLTILKVLISAACRRKKECIIQGLRLPACYAL